MTHIYVVQFSPHFFSPPHFGWPATQPDDWLSPAQSWVSMNTCLCFPGWRDRQLPCRGDHLVPAENHADPRRVRVAGLHHAVWRHWNFGPIYFTRGKRLPSVNPFVWFWLAILNHLALLFVQDHDFFQHLEMHMRSEFPPLCGRDHLSFRSYYFPVKVSSSSSSWYQSSNTKVLAFQDEHEITQLLHVKLISHSLYSWMHNCPMFQFVLHSNKVQIGQIRLRLIH